jgi:hypothetical protein
MKRSISRLTLLLVALSVSGCAAMLNGTEQDVTVHGYPNRTRLKMTDSGGAVVYDGPSPGQVKLRRKETYKLTVSRPGFSPETVTVASSTNWVWLIPAFTITGPFEIISFANGSVKEFDENGIEVTIFGEGRRPAGAVVFEP